MQPQRLDVLEHCFKRARCLVHLGRKLLITLTVFDGSVLVVLALELIQTLLGWRQSKDLLHALLYVLERQPYSTVRAEYLTWPIFQLVIDLGTVEHEFAEVIVLQ